MSVQRPRKERRTRLALTVLAVTAITHGCAATCGGMRSDFRKSNHLTDEDPPEGGPLTENSDASGSEPEDLESASCERIANACAGVSRSDVTSCVQLAAGRIDAPCMPYETECVDRCNEIRGVR